MELFYTVSITFTQDARGSAPRNCIRRDSARNLWFDPLSSLRTPVQLDIRVGPQPLDWYQELMSSNEYTDWCSREMLHTTLFDVNPPGIFEAIPLNLS